MKSWIALLLLSFVWMCSSGQCCRCALFSLERYFCGGDYMVRVHVNGKSVEESSPDDRLVGLPASYFRVTAYDVDVRDVFKANATIKSWLESEAKIWVDGFAAHCGTTLFKGRDFIIAGRFRDNKLWVSACGYARDVNLLSKSDKKFFDEKKYQTIDCRSLAD